MAQHLQTIGRGSEQEEVNNEVKPLQPSPIYH